MMKLASKGLFIIISGPSGAGKGTICDSVLKMLPKSWCSISATTRSIRGTEKDGIDYYFLSKEIFEEKIKNQEFLEYAIVHNQQYYGTPKKEVIERLEEGIDVILEIDINGALQIKKMYPEALFIFIMPPSMKELKKRLINRGTESKEKIIERFKNAYKEINQINKYNYVVVNDCLDEAIHKVNSIIAAEKCKVNRIEDLDINSIEEEIHERLVDLMDSQ